jgi:DNA-binding SARP family transcriptional activator
MEALWPDEDPSVATRRLSVALTTARSVLDPDKTHPPDYFLVGERDLIRIDLSHVPVDIEEFLSRRRLR